MQLQTIAIVCAVRPHGEHGAVVRALTPSEGMQAGYVRGGRSRRLRPVLMPGNVIEAAYRARTEEQLAQLSVELTHSRAPLLAEALPAAAVEWACALTAATLPEGQPYPRLYEALEGLLSAVEAAPSARGWAAALLRYELLVLRELGFGVEAAESAALAELGPESGWDAILEGLRNTGELLARDLLAGRRAGPLDARERLVERLRRVTR